MVFRNAATDFLNVSAPRMNLDDSFQAFNHPLVKKVGIGFEWFLN